MSPPPKEGGDILFSGEFPSASASASAFQFLSGAYLPNYTTQKLQIWYGAYPYGLVVPFGGFGSMLPIIFLIFTKNGPKM